MATTSLLSRRQFLRGRMSTLGHPALRPPWATTEVDFQALCTRCDDCLSACAERVLVRGSGGFPEVDFRIAACTFCGDCAAVCKTGALIPGRGSQAAAWNLDVVISEMCLSGRGIVCRACGDACDARAIRFRHRIGGGAELLLDARRCTGCGACANVCPEGAVTLQRAAEAES